MYSPIRFFLAARTRATLTRAVTERNLNTNKLIIKLPSFTTTRPTRLGTARTRTRATFATTATVDFNFYRRKPNFRLRILDDFHCTPVHLMSVQLFDGLFHIAFGLETGRSAQKHGRIKRKTHPTHPSLRCGLCASQNVTLKPFSRNISLRSCNEHKNW